MGSKDFSFMLNARPGAMLWLGNGPGEGGCLLHNARYDFNDAALPVGVSFFARLAERFLSPRREFMAGRAREDGAPGWDAACRAFCGAEGPLRRGGCGGTVRR